MTDDVFEKIAKSNEARNITEIPRRALKLAEETGEVAQAVVAVTSKKNSKRKTWADVREECADVIIIAIDIALTEMPDQEGSTLAGRIKEIKTEIDRKILKWLKAK